MLVDNSYSSMTAKHFIGILVVLLFFGCAPSEFKASDTVQATKSAVNQVDVSAPSAGRGSNSAVTSSTTQNVTSPPSVVGNSPALTGNRDIDDNLRDVEELVVKTDPSVNPRGIYYVGLNVLEASSIFGFVYQRQLTTGCSVSFTAQVLGMQVVNEAKVISSSYCDGFVLAQQLRSQRGGSCTPRSTTMEHLNVTLNAQEVYESDFNYVLDSDCVCKRSFEFKVLGGGVVNFKVNAFLSKEKCAQIFP